MSHLSLPNAGDGSSGSSGRECLLSHSDDHTLKLWDFAEASAGNVHKALIATLNGHSAKVMGSVLV